MTEREDGLLGDITVLHVEDDSIIRFHLEAILGKRVKELISVEDGETGLEEFRRLQPDVVISDIRLPGMSGLEMIEAIREEDPEAPVIVTSAYSDVEYMLKAIELGVDKYLVKPFEPSQVQRAVIRSARSVLAHRRIAEAHRYANFLLDINPNFIATFDGDEVEYINSTFLDFMGFSSLQTFILSGRTIADFVQEVDGHQDATRRERWHREVMKKPDGESIIRLNGGDGETERACLASHNRFDDTGKVVLVLTDITKLDNERKCLAVQAKTDYLTGLSNRLSILERLDEEMARANRYGQPLSLVMFDIDDFKRVNDVHGHVAGDEVLKALASGYREHLRENDMLARWGGEEFLLLLPGCDDAQAGRVADKLLRLLREEPVGPDGGITISFGVTGYLPGEKRETVLERVDQALHQAKSGGKDRLVAL
ncbi:sensor domain-containing diguanylate cyclase [Desulfohalovibrio reitneri]|uniref:sensor domain-containing diguanylate cyclase n=1 Tax=Desulfohalovibrio reitneri TaxID=1307759 RepID=UPI0004A6BB98|nr:diguanylate cyclase [Desulfohalovibrio reitneri]